MKNFTKITLAALAAVMMSCSGDDSGSPANGSCETDVAWLQSGKFVDYKLSQFGFDAGSMKMSFGNCNGDGFVTTREMRDPNGTVVSTTSDLIFQDGNFVKNDVGSDGIDITTLYKKNAALGDIWTETRTDGRVITHEVVNMDSTVTVPAGTFHCKVYKYTTSTAANESYIFWSDEIGQIMEDAGFFKLELQNHNYN
ncbi:hypothetical protein [Flavobacterium sp.]|uniref:hypothetical protein n=1 Tax=Flavobacterium sp. TaxID=239 RepID=UPI00121598AF|nr:hypothetical protein [Flavobacterium sp.]RZJ71431.1 MAG: hypothetical protein EOO49_10240 [Flavobacterium sp.]